MDKKIIDVLVQDITEDKMAEQIAKILNDSKDVLDVKRIIRAIPSESLISKITKKLNDKIKAALEETENNTDDVEAEPVLPQNSAKETQEELSKRLKALELINDACSDKKSHLVAIDEKRLLQVLDSNFDNVTGEEADNMCKIFNKLAYSKTVDNNIKTLFKTLSASLSKYRKSMTSDNMITVSGEEEGAAKTIPVNPQIQPENNENKEVSAGAILGNIYRDAASSSAAKGKNKNKAQ